MLSKRNQYGIRCAVGFDFFLCVDSSTSSSFFSSLYLSSPLACSLTHSLTFRAMGPHTIRAFLLIHVYLLYSLFISSFFFSFLMQPTVLTVVTTTMFLVHLVRLPHLAWCELQYVGTIFSCAKVNFTCRARDVI